jgi:hypothetical protein
MNKVRQTMATVHLPELRCEAQGCTAVSPPADDIKTYLALHLPSGAHSLHCKPLTEEQLRSVIYAGSLTLEIGEFGAEPAGIVFLCDHHAEVGLRFQRTGTTPPLVLDPKKGGELRAG